MKEALLVQYAGVYAPPPSVAAARQGRTSAAGEQLAYTVVRPSTVTATRRRARTATSHPLDSGGAQPGTYRFTWTTFDAEGTWHWNVQATDDLEPRLDGRPDVPRTT